MDEKNRTHDINTTELDWIIDFTKIIGWIELQMMNFATCLILVSLKHSGIYIFTIL